MDSEIMRVDPRTLYLAVCRKCLGARLTWLKGWNASQASALAHVLTAISGIESRYNLYARNRRSSAVGLWQLLRPNRTSEYNLAPSLSIENQISDALLLVRRWWRWWVTLDSAERRRRVRYVSNLLHISLPSHMGESLIVTFVIQLPCLWRRGIAENSQIDSKYWQSLGIYL